MQFSLKEKLVTVFSRSGAIGFVGPLRAFLDATDHHYYFYYVAAGTQQAEVWTSVPVVYRPVAANDDTDPPPLVA